MTGFLPEATRAAFEGGALERIAGYRKRPRQLEMARAVASAMETGGVHMLEAGTGVGKSLAYLVPSLASGRRVIVSTATKTLQDQLFEKDIPAVRAALGTGASTALLKGRNNYVCLRKWLAGRSGALGRALDEWVSKTSTGDVSELEKEPDPEVWIHLRSDPFDCLAQSCPHRSSCHFQKARAEARKADLLVLNHHLLLSGVCTGELVPEAEVLVADEAHRLEDAAAECLGPSLSPQVLMPLYDGIAFSDAGPLRKGDLLERVRSVQDAVERVCAPVADAVTWDPDEHDALLEEISSGCSALASELSGEEGMEAAATASSAVAAAVAAVRTASRGDNCFFAEPAGRCARIRVVPLDLGEAIRSAVYSRFETTILTSATLSVAGSFAYTASRLGVEEPRSAVDFGSPFDYANQAVIAVPEDLPEPDDHEALSQAAWTWASRLAGILGGRTMALFTSNRNLALAAEAARRDPARGVRVLVQGEMTRSRILACFRDDPRGIILATASFWEGVDLPGSTLQALVIDRLPFSSPGHPLVSARMLRIEERGGSSFRELALPGAVIRLRQGVGRLIRSDSDRGVLVILDRRIRTSSYGSVIARSLPAFRQVDEDEALEFARRECLEAP